MTELFGWALKGIGWVFLLVMTWPLLILFFPNSDRIDTLSRASITLLDDSSYRIGEIVKWALPLLVLSIAFSVFALSIFGLNWTKLSESAAYFHASIIMLGAAATLLAGQHVRVDVFHTRMSAKSRALVDFMGFYALLLPVCLIIIWDSQSFVNFAWRIFEGSSENDGIQGVFLLKTLVPVFGVMMITQGLSIAMRAAMCLHGKERPARPDHTPQLFPPLENQPKISNGNGS